MHAADRLVVADRHHRGHRILREECGAAAVALQIVGVREHCTRVAACLRGQVIADRLGGAVGRRQRGVGEQAATTEDEDQEGRNDPDDQQRPRAAPLGGGRGREAWRHRLLVALLRRGLRGRRVHRRGGGVTLLGRPRRLRGGRRRGGRGGLGWGGVGGGGVRRG